VREDIIFLIGPTAVGKTEIAVCLAKKINAEIISCDSMQIYRGMDILTSKPSQFLRKNTPHHLLSIISSKKEYNVSRYYKDTAIKVKKIIKRGKVPLIVGGTGLYISILLDGIFKAKTQNKIIRSRLYKEAKNRGSEHLYKRLQEVDAEAALKIHPHDTKRIIRALEAFQTCGKPISQLQKERKGLNDEFDIKIFGLNMERGKLYERIERRIDKMFNQGLLEEAKKLLKLKLSKTARYAIGINEIKGYLDGQYGLEEAKRLMKKNTRHYAKRQLTWFRKDKRIEWVEIKDKEAPESVANRIFKKLRNYI
jgi:tRNA dimethylallyltransferase